MITKKPQIIGAVFILFGLLFIVLAWGGHFQSKKVIDKGGRAVADITDKKIERSRPGAPLNDPAVSIDYNVYYTFRTNDGNKLDVRYAIRKGTWDNLKIGDSIEVAYDFDNPNYNFPVELNRYAVVL